MGPDQVEARWVKILGAQLQGGGSLPGAHLYIAFSARPRQIHPPCNFWDRREMTAHHTSVAEMQRTAKPQDPLTIIIKITSAGRAASPLILTTPYEVRTGIISILRMGKLRQR